MKLTRPRFTVRRMMVAVAILAGLLAAEKMRRVWRERSLMAARSAAEADTWSGDAAAIERMMIKPRSLGDPASLKRLADLEEFASNYRAHERYHRELASTFARGARRPWLPMEPAPPEPK